jgi:tetratricopeptide (TPR) repeat protein
MDAVRGYNATMRLRSRPTPSPGSLFLRAALGAAAAVCAVASPAPARADDSASAQALFDEAVALKAKEEWAKACPKFASSYKLDPALGTLLNLANCYEKVGQIASAWAKWEEAYQWATKNNDNRAEYAMKQRDALVPRLSKLTITVTSPVPGLSIERDTSAVSEAMYGTALPVDPGAHSVFIKRDDEILKTEKITVAEAQSAALSFDLAAIEKAAPPPRPRTAVMALGPAPVLRKVGWAVGAGGLAAVLAAGVIEGLAVAKKEQADDPASCFKKLCTPQGKGLADQASTLAEAGQWVGIGGLAVVAVGVTLLIVTPSQVVLKSPPGDDKRAAKKPERNLWATPWVAPVADGRGGPVQMSGGLAVGGSL